MDTESVREYMPRGALDGSKSYGVSRDQQH